MSFTVTLDQQRFPVGASVAAYPQANFSGAAADVAPNGVAPSGSATETQTVGAGGVVTFTTLTGSTGYYGVYNAGGGDYRYVRFFTPSAANGAVSVIEDEGSALTVRSNVNFVGAGVTAADTGGKTVVTIPSGGGAAYVGPGSESFNVKTDFGAKGDGAQFTGGITGTAVTANTATFASTDVGKKLYIPGAGVAGIGFLTTISGFTDSTHVTAAGAAGTNVTGKWCTFGTDDTATIQAAVDYLASHHGGRIYCPRGIYCVAGSFRTTPTFGSAGSAHWNAQITVPLIAGSGGRLTIEFEGEKQAFFDATIPDGASIICSLSPGAANDATNGVPCLLGGPTYVNQAFDNVRFSSSRMTWMCPENPNLTCLNLRGLLGPARLDDTIVTTHPGWNANVQPTNPVAAGVLLPGISNYGFSGADGEVWVAGYYLGVSIGEHHHFQRLQLMRNVIAIQPDKAGHWWTADNIVCERNNYILAGWDPASGAISPASGSASYFDVRVFDIEDGSDWSAPVAHVLDANNQMHGSAGYWRLQSNLAWTVTGAKFLLDYQADGYVHAVGGSGEPAYQNSWTNAPSVGGARFWKDKSGLVHIDGAIAGGAASTTVFTLPAYWRPTGYKLFPDAVNTNGVEINPSTGDVFSKLAGTAGARVTLDGITFRARD